MKVVQDAELGSRSGAASQESEQPLPLAESIAMLAQAIEVNNDLLVQIVSQNAMLIEAMAEGEDEVERGPARDLSGRPLQLTYK